MSRFLPFPLPRHSNQSQSNHIQFSDYPSSSNSSLLPSLPSLPSVPSLIQDHPTPVATHHLLTTLNGHSSYIFSITLAGKHLYTADSNGEIRIWDIYPSSSNPPNNKNVIIGEVYSAVKSIIPLGDKLITGHNDHKIRVWKINSSNQNYKLVTTLPTLNDRCVSLFSAKECVKVRRHKKSTWVHHVDAVSGLALSGSLLYSVSWDRSLKIWRTSDFRCVDSVQNAHDDAINAVVLSEDGHVYTGSADKKIKVWRRCDGERGFKHSFVSTLEKHKSAVNALALSNDGSVLYSGACDRSIIVWEKDRDGPAHMAVAGALRGHKKAILCLAIVLDLLCSGSADKTVRIWRKGSGNSCYSCLAVFEGHRSPVKCLTTTFLECTKSDGDCDDLGNSYLVYSGSLDFDVKVWQIWVPF